MRLFSKRFARKQIKLASRPDFLRRPIIEDWQFLACKTAVDQHMATLRRSRRAA
jgi:hypothetical protein